MSKVAFTGSPKSSRIFRRCGIVGIGYLYEIECEIGVRARLILDRLRKKAKHAVSLDGRIHVLKADPCFP